MSFTETTLQSNGIGFHAYVDGPRDGPLVLLLHGFPELARSWFQQIPPLAQAGYRVVVPDMRGYGGTDKTGPYDLWTLSADIAGLVKSCGREKAIIIGHDWGAGVAWATAVLQPQVVEQLGILNCPHPSVLAKKIFSTPAQFARSWYMFFFQLPWLPEFLTTRDRGSAIARSLRGGSKVRDHWTREELTPYAESFIQPGAASAAIGYYRAAFRTTFKFDQAALAHPITAPTRIIWGAEDQFLGRDSIDQAVMRPYFAAGNTPVIELIEGAGHFVQNEAPDRVNAALLKWLAR
jgi:pimeloyl-ACP methyl ester carboxylesterase